jgi:glyoxylase-like metal-dependent hydrolase (beta-lactamase superfamily II)
MKIHALQTGTIAIKNAHRRMRVPAPLRLPAIVLDPTFTEPLPILAWAIEHPEGLIVIDTGETARVHEPDYFQGGARWFLTRNFRFQIDREQEIDYALKRAGLSAGDVRWLIITHVHTDHMGGVYHFPKAEILLSRTEIERPYAPIDYRWPSWFNPRRVDYDAEGRFLLTRAGDVELIATPGHSAGHQSVRLRREGAPDVLFAGDASFSDDQLRRDEVGGIVLNVPQTRSTADRLRALLRQRAAIYLPSHDPASVDRLAAGTIYTA